MAALASHGQAVAACELLADLTVLTVTPDEQQPAASTGRKAVSGLRDTPAPEPDSKGLRPRQAVVRAVGQHVPRWAVPQQPVTAAAMLTEDLLVSGNGHSLLLLQRDVPAEEAAAAQLLLEAQQESSSGMLLAQVSGSKSGNASRRLQPSGIGGSKPCNLRGLDCIVVMGLHAPSGLPLSSWRGHQGFAVQKLVEQPHCEPGTACSAHAPCWLASGAPSCMPAGAASQSAGRHPIGVKQQLRQLQVLAGCNMQGSIVQILPGALGLTSSVMDLLISYHNPAGHSTYNDGGRTTEISCQPGMAGNGISQQMPSAVCMTRDGSVGCVTALTSEQLSESLKQHPLNDSHDVLGASALEAWKSHDAGTVPLNINLLHCSGRPWPLSSQMNL